MADRDTPAWQSEAFACLQEHKVELFAEAADCLAFGILLQDLERIPLRVILIQMPVSILPLLGSPESQPRDHLKLGVGATDNVVQVVLGSQLFQPRLVVWLVFEWNGCSNDLFVVGIDYLDRFRPVYSQGWHGFERDFLQPGRLGWIAGGECQPHLQKSAA